MVNHPPRPSPDALLFDSLLNNRPIPAREEAQDLADLVLRLAGAVRETTVALREASACLAQPQGPAHLPELLIRAEAACLEQANCTTALIQRLAPRLAAA